MLSPPKTRTFVGAKFAIDNKLYKVVFVCSDEVAPIQMGGKLVSAADNAPVNSSSSCGPVVSDECSIGDLADSEAIEYLTVKRKIERDRASKVFDFCIQLLKRICDRLEKGVDLDSLCSPLLELLTCVPL